MSSSFTREFSSLMASLLVVQWSLLVLVIPALIFSLFLLVRCCFHTQRPHRNVDNFSGFITRTDDLRDTVCKLILYLSN